MKTKLLLFIGLCCMVGGSLAGIIASKPADRSDAIAQHLGELLAVLIGIGLIITHFVIYRKPRR